MTDVGMSSLNLQQANGRPTGLSSRSRVPASRKHTGALTGKIRFRRQRADKACETCHARKVRCDADSLGFPCTNCVAFGIECRIFTSERKKCQIARKRLANNAVDNFTSRRCSASDHRTHHASSPAESADNTGSPSSPGSPSAEHAQGQAEMGGAQPLPNSNFDTMLQWTCAPLSQAGRVAFLGESSHISFLIRNCHSSVSHYPLPSRARDHSARLSKLDRVEVDILHQRGAFLLPPRALCDDIFKAYFQWVHPIVPVIDRTQFMRQYRDSSNPPSLLLLQAMLLAGSRVCSNPQLMDAHGSTHPVALTFYRRAKALYDANYEDDRVTIVQALLLMGWYWEGPANVIQNASHWTRIATTVAQASGMHRSVERSRLSRSDKRLWKRLWWALVTRDRVLAASFGRPIQIHLDDSDVEELTEDDFMEEGEEGDPGRAIDPVHVQFFLQYVKLCRIMGGILSQQYSIASVGRYDNAIHLARSDKELAHWLANCPEMVHWEVRKHHFWSALLYSHYATTLCLLHRTHMFPSKDLPKERTRHSRNATFHASAMIASVAETLSTNGELRFCPAFTVYSILSALVMHVHQIRSSVPSFREETQNRLHACLRALREVSKVWFTGKMVSTLFEAIIGGQGLGGRPEQAGDRSQSEKTSVSQQIPGTRSNMSQQKTPNMAPDSSPNYHTSSYSRTCLTPQPSDGSLKAPTLVSSDFLTLSGDAFMELPPTSLPQANSATTTNPLWCAPTPPNEPCVVNSKSPDLWQPTLGDSYADGLFLDGSSMHPFSDSSINQTHYKLEPDLIPDVSIPSSASFLQPSQHKNTTNEPQKPDQSVHFELLPLSTWLPNYDGTLQSDQHPEGQSIWQGQQQPTPAAPMLEDWLEYFGLNYETGGENVDRVFI